jgi:hypothetical protein
MGIDVAARGETGKGADFLDLGAIDSYLASLPESPLKPGAMNGARYR